MNGDRGYTGFQYPIGGVRLGRTTKVDQRARTCDRRHSHGGVGCGSTHKPLLNSRASFSSVSSSMFPGAYFRYHQHQPSLTSSWLTLVPSGKSTSAMVRPYLSWPWVWRMTSLPKTNADAACFARLPKAWPCSGQSMPLRRTRSAWVLCRTSMVSSSRTEELGRKQDNECKAHCSPTPPCLYTEWICIMGTYLRLCPFG